MLNNQLLSLRLRSGMTQEDLSERSGISVRTIRNLERGQVQRPRRSSVELLLTVLEPDRRTELAGPGPGAWRGPRPARTSLVGRDSEVERLARLVAENQVVVVAGPGGVGKSRVALAAAQHMGHWFGDGVAVAEMGRIPAEHQGNSQTITDQTLAVVLKLLTSAPKPPDHGLLLVLDNTEHLPLTTVSLINRLLGEYPSLHILITTRRVPKLHGASVWEILPLADEPAAKLLLQRLLTTCPTLDLSGDDARVTELCRQLDGIPRLLEFAAHRLRMVSLPTLLSHHRATRLLGSSDLAMLPHQRTLEASMRWSLALLDERQHDLLFRLAGHPGPIHHHDAARSGASQYDFSELDTLELLADLADASLLQVDRGQEYRYRMLNHVQAFLENCDDRSRYVSAAM
ncbi:helix-turn-helix domain-containing protein [Streptomyces sp. DT193]|uniref:helix-turn-helix domain-containing protein n=1 Tax=Streptomyces sp. DT193 TaxID=3393418 RepID=UPI003CFAAA39